MPIAHYDENGNKIDESGNELNPDGSVRLKIEQKKKRFGGAQEGSGRKPHPALSDPKIIAFIKGTLEKLSFLPRKLMTEEKMLIFVNHGLAPQGVQLNMNMFKRFLKEILGMTYIQVMSAGETNVQLVVASSQLQLAQKGHFGMLKHLGINVLDQKDSADANPVLPSEPGMGFQLQYKIDQEKPQKESGDSIEAEFTEVSESEK